MRIGPESGGPFVRHARGRRPCSRGLAQPFEMSLAAASKHIKVLEGAGLTHRQLPDRHMSVLVGAGWHMHCDILVARLKGERPASFWRGWVRLRGEYETILSS